MAKIFVLDTNVILHDYRSIYNFQENDLVIPMAVLEEVDKFKKGNSVINYNAREFVRLIDRISDSRLYEVEKGYPLGEGRGTLAIEINHPFSDELKGCFLDDFQDHRILSTTLWVKAKNPGRTVGLVTKDVNLRLKARALGLLSQDYLTGHIKEERVALNDARIIFVKNAGKGVLEKLQRAGINPSAIADQLCTDDLAANQLFRFRAPATGDILARYNKKYNLIQPVASKVVMGIKPLNAEQVFALELLMDPSVRLLSITGTSGSGKSLLSLAAAISQNNVYDKIMVACKTDITAGSEMEHVMIADVDRAYSLFTLPVQDNLDVIKNSLPKDSRELQTVESLTESEKVVVTPLSLLRGRSLMKTFLIVEDAQNLSPDEVKSIITRAAQGTKIVFTGNLRHIEHPYLDRWSNGLVHITDKMYGENIFAHINLSRGERSELSQIAEQRLGEASSNPARANEDEL